MSTFDRYALADALLAGDQAARWVLVDLLSDSGDCEEADFIRRTGTSRAGDLDVAIRQIGCPDVALLGCDFLEHCANRQQAGLHSLLGRVRRLLRRGGSAEQFTAASRSLADYRSAEGSWYDAWLLLAQDDAVHAFSAAVEAAAPHASQPRAAAVAVTNTARLLRGAILAQYHVKKKPGELNWQIKHSRLSCSVSSLQLALASRTAPATLPRCCPMDAPDRYALALAMLDGDRAARKVLADLLEEQGERGLAQWARQGRHDKRRTLEFAVTLLPCRSAIGLVSDFIVHAFDDKREAELLDSLPYFLFQWSAGQLGTHEAVVAGRQMIGAVSAGWDAAGGRRRARMPEPRLFKETLEQLVDAIDYSGRAEACESGELASGTPRHWQGTATQHLRAAIAACQNRAQAVGRQRPPNPDTLTELDWQLKQTKALFTRLLAEETP